MSSKINLPHAFLKRFVKKIVLNALPPDVLLEEYIDSEAAQLHLAKIKDQAQLIKPEIEKLPYPIKNTKIEEMEASPFSIKKEFPHTSSPKPLKPLRPRTRKQSPSFHPVAPRPPENPRLPDLPQKTDQGKITIEGEKIQGPTFGRVTPYVNNPRVQSIEIPGPDKPILIRQQGLINTSSIQLNKDEIENVLQNVSEITRIPLIEGPFKAIIENLLITAVYSPSVGSRFIVQKIAPYVPHQ